MAEKDVFHLPFGRTSLPRRPSNTSSTQLFVLGAYPSALHVRWTPPGPYKMIQALAVDNEPEPFWNGEDAAERIEKWRQDVGFRSEWGEIRDVGRLNGSSGVWIDEHVLKPLGVRREEACITDCLDLYHASTGAMARIADTYAPFAKQYALPQANVPSHPSENVIVAGAVGAHLPRLRAELAAASPELIVTLGNAALRVFAALLAEIDGAGPGSCLSAADGSYGRPWRVSLPDGRTASWIPLAHPAAPGRYQEAHQRWIARQPG